MSAAWIPDDRRLPEPRQAMRQMQIIAGALIAGVLVFAAVAVMVVGDQPPDPDLQIILLVFIAISVPEIVAWAVVPNMMADRSIGSLSQHEEHGEGDRAIQIRRLYANYQTKMIISYALLEGVAFLHLIGYLIARYWWSLAVAGGMVLLMLATFPTRTRVEHWVEDRMQILSLRG